MLLTILLFISFAHAETLEVEGYECSLLSDTGWNSGIRVLSYALSPLPDTGLKPQRIFLLEADPHSSPSLHACVQTRNGHVHASRMKVSELCEQSGAENILAAVNGDFFDTASGGPLGWTMSDGRWITAGEFDNGICFGIREDGAAIIGNPEAVFTYVVERNGSCLLEGNISALNAPRADSPSGTSLPANASAARSDNTAVLYTDDYSSSTRTPAGGTELLFTPSEQLSTGSTVSGTVEGISSAGDMQILPGQAVLSFAPGSAPEITSVRKGDMISVTCHASPLFDGAVAMTGGGRPDGGPQLVYAGEICSWQKVGLDDASYFYDARHARTAAGTRPDGTWFILLAEGNRPGSSGMTVDELAKTMKMLGAEYAVNLDGATSSTLVLPRGKGFRAVSNTTDSAGELKVGCALIIYSDKE